MLVGLNAIRARASKIPVSGCPRVFENLKILKMFWNLSWNLPFSEFCPRMSWNFFATVHHFLVIISVRVPSTLKNLEYSLLSLILFDNFDLGFFVPLHPYL